VPAVVQVQILAAYGAQALAIGLAKGFDGYFEQSVFANEGVQINVRRDGTYHMFEFDQTADEELDFVRWNKELDAEQGE